MSVVSSLLVALREETSVLPCAINSLNLNATSGHFERRKNVMMPIQNTNPNIARPLQFDPQAQVGDPRGLTPIGDLLRPMLAPTLPNSELSVVQLLVQSVVVPLVQIVRELVGQMQGVFGMTPKAPAAVPSPYASQTPAVNAAPKEGNLLTKLGNLWEKASPVVETLWDWIRGRGKGGDSKGIGGWIGGLASKAWDWIKGWF